MNYYELKYNNIWTSKKDSYYKDGLILESSSQIFQKKCQKTILSTIHLKWR